jgi:type IX secretion system PorP/SprF family membrane protein
MYSYPVQINSKIMVNLGFQASIVQNSINATGLILGDQNPFQPGGQAEVVPNQSNFYPDFSAGFSIYANEQYQFSLAVNHLNTPAQVAGTNNMNKLPMRITCQILSQFPSGSDGKESKLPIFFPGIMTQWQKESVELNYGCNVQYGPFLTGLWFRNDLYFHMNTFIFLAGYSWKGMHLTYSYDLWIPKTFQPSSFYGSHEVTFIYLLKYKDQTKKLRALKCPKF